MDDFLDSIEALRQGEIGLGELCAAFEALVAQDPALAHEALGTLVALSNQGRFPPQVVTMLEGRLPKAPRRTRAHAAPAAPQEPEPAAPSDDATVVVSTRPPAPAPDATPTGVAPAGAEDTGAPPTEPTQPTGSFATSPPTRPTGGFATSPPSLPTGDQASAQPGSVATSPPTQPTGGFATSPPTQPTGGFATNPPSLPTGDQASAQPGSVATSPPTQPTGGAPADNTAATERSTPSQSRSGSGSGWSERFNTANLADPGGEARVPEVGTVLRGRFELIEELGRGGMGVVFKARDRSRDEVGYTNEEENYVAIKLLNEEFKRHRESIRVFGREFRNTQKLKHPNIVNLYDFDRDDFGNYFIAMELLAGEPLNQMVRRLRGKGLPFAEAFRLIEQMGLALAAAHGIESPIIHSDFKPGNVFLGPDNVIKVFDFGIARAARPAAGDSPRNAPDNASLDLGAPSTSGATQESTTFVQGVGALTVSYASPEMLLGQDPELRDDLYALAIVAYQLLAGERPFRDPNCKDINAPDCRDALLKARKLLPPRPPRLSARQWKALQKGLAFERDGRCHNVPEFIDELRPRASRLPYAIAAGLVVGGVVGWYAGVAPWLAHQQQAKAEAQTAALLAEIATAAPAALNPQPPAGLPAALQARVTEAVIARLANQLISPDSALRTAARARLDSLPEATRNTVFEHARIALTKELRNAAPALMIPRLTVLEELPPVPRSIVIAEIGDPIREALLAEVRAAFAPNANAYDYARANELLAQAERLQPGLKVIDDERVQLSGRYERLLSALDERITKLREGGNLLPRDGQDSIPQVLALLRQVAPAQYGKYAYLATIYSAAAQAAEDSDLAQAQAYVDAGLALFPDSTELKNQRARLEDMVQNQTKEQAVAALRARVERALEAHGDQPPTPALVADLVSLREDRPDDPLLARASKLALTAWDAALPTLLTARDWAQAEALLARWQGMADPAGLAARQRSIKAARAAVTARIAAREQALDTALAARDVAAVEAALVALAEEDPNNDAIARGRDELARVFLGQAREARAAGRFDDARALVAEALGRAGDPQLKTSLNEERTSIDAAEAASRQQLAAAEQAKAAAERAARVEALRGEFNSYVQRMAVTPAGVAEARGLLDRLAGLAPDDPLLTSGLEAIAGRFATQAAEQGRAGKFEAALATVASGLRLVPGAAVLTAERARLTQEYQSVQADQARAALAAQQQTVDGLLTDADFSADWAKRTGAALRELASLAGADTTTVDAAGQRLDRLFEGHLAGLLADNQFVEARALLEQWAGLRVGGGEPQRQAKARVAEAFAAWERTEEQRRQRAEIEANKQTLLTQARADQPEKALATFQSLRTRMGTDEPFVTTEAPAAIAAAYVRMATQSTRRGRHETAQNLVDKALELAPATDVAALRQEIARNQARDAFTAQLANASDPTALSALAQPLAEVQRLAGTEFAGWSEEWGKTLVRQIKAADADAAEALLAAARALLPGSRTLKDLKLSTPALALPTPLPRPSGALTDARTALAAHRLSAAGQALTTARTEAAGDPALADLAQDLDTAKANAEKLYKLYELAVTRGELAKAERALSAAVGLWSDNPDWQTQGISGTQLAAARPVPVRPAAGKEPCNPRFAGYGNNRTARCADSLGGKIKGPELVVVPAGGGNQRPFAIARYEVSVGEFNTYCSASRECAPLAARSLKLPATGMSITQAEAYAVWLSRVTGATYRLPTASEWQFAATANGDTLTKDANCLLRSGGSTVKGGAAVLVSTGVNNSWGLVNAIGNVQEWTRAGATVQAHGGHFAVDTSHCTVSYAVGHSGQGDARTGFRLVKEIGG